MKEANYNHLKLNNFPSLRSDGSGSASKRRQVFHSNTENTRRDEAAYNNANLGGLHGSRGNSGNPSDLLLITPSGGTVFDMNAQATPTERPSLSNLTNQSLRPSGRVCMLNLK
ncbi:uncharacterized protein LOC108216341 [Daucus carota subsp. sativus]|uniref:uncharacterized protein LOC108216341 n=1 Tax=Daucus carota subsp. sativus TaxID=79200 RepID=UPI00308351F6